MKALFGSLAFRLGVGIAAIVIAAFFALVYAYQQSIKYEFHQFVEVETRIFEAESSLIEDLGPTLSSFYALGGWREVKAALPEGPLLLLDADGRVIAGQFEEGTLVDFSISEDQIYEIKVDLGPGDNNQVWLVGVPGFPLVTEGGEVLGHLLFMATPELADRSAGFATSVSETAAWFIIPVALLTLVLVGLLVRYGLNPVHQVTKAAKTLRGGKIPAAVKAKATGEVGDLVTAFNSAVRELARTEEMRKKIISDAAHELRTPVTNLKGQLEAMEAGLIKKDGDFLKVMKAETGLLESLVGDLQDLAISDAGRLKVFPENLNLKTELDEAWKGFHGAKSAKLVNEVPGDIEVHADPRRFRQIVQNLFSNALNAKPKGLALEIDTNVVGKIVEISITDNGPGIDPDDLSHIFQRFYRADQSRARKTGGAGLGLAIVKTLIEAHGGTISIKSAKSGGATVCFSLPLAK